MGGVNGIFSQTGFGAFRAMIEHSRDPYYVVSPSRGYRLVYVNSAASQVMGYSRERMLEMVVADWDPNFSTERLDELWAALRRDGNAIFFTTVRPRSGEALPLEVTMNHLVIGDEAFMAGHFRDIAERHALQRRLEGSERRFRTLAESSPIGIFQADPTGLNVYCNVAWERISGLSAEQTRDEGWMRVIHPEDLRRLLASWREAVAGKAVWSAEARLVRPDGGVVHCLMRAAPELDERGELLSFVGTVVDIDDRKRAEAELEEGIAVYQAAINTPALGFWVVDTDGRFQEVNEAYCQLSGYRREELLQMGIQDVEAMETPTAIRAHIRELMVVGYARFRSEHRRRDGTLWPVEVVASGPCGKYCNSQRPANASRQGALRREWQVLPKECNAALAH